MTAGEKAFVFVVCGVREHTETLHYSLKALLQYTSLPVYVVTDSKRNEEAIKHNHIIDIETPKHFNHHQASIYLKTGLNKFLPTGPLYCYLDTDIVALSERVNDVFGQWVAPITFAPDHCTMDEFSPFAVNCTCKHDYEVSCQNFSKAEAEFESTLAVEYETTLAEINKATEYNKRNPFVYLFHMLRYYFSGTHYNILNGKFLLERKTQRWQNVEGDYIDAKYNRYAFFKRKMNLDWSEQQQAYLKPNGEDFFKAGCNHLHQLIEQDFGHRVTPANYRHWNGGGFLFNEESDKFLNFWHSASLRIFELPDWKTRDQGTLIATIWEFNLQRHPTIDIQFNLIIDYFANRMKYLGHLTFLHPEKGEVKPAFAHVFHHFGDSTWKVWQDIDEHVNSKNIPQAN